MWALIVKFIDRILVVLGALLFLQIPMFMHQYELLLEGHRAELHYQVAEMKKAAAHSGKNLDQYIKKFTDSTDVDFARQGELMSSTVLRWSQFVYTLQVLQEASVWSHPFVFIKNIQYEVVKNTLKNFQGGLNLTYESVVYGLIGILFGYLSFALLKENHAFSLL